MKSTFVMHSTEWHRLMFAAAFICAAWATMGGNSRQIAAPVRGAPTNGPGNIYLQTGGTPTITQNASPAPGKVQLVDSARDHFGGRIYTTGLGDVTITRLCIHLPLERPLGSSLTPPTSASVGISGAIDPVTGYNMKNPITAESVYLMSPDRKYKRKQIFGCPARSPNVTNLGRLPPGEIILGIDTSERVLLQTGSATNNPDHLVHDVTRTYTSGRRMQVWFENALGPVGAGQSERKFNGVVLELQGDVSDSSAVPDLLKVIREQKGAVRDAAIVNLKQICPEAAANAGY